MTTKNKNHDLDAHEKEILEEFEKGNFVSVSDLDEKMQIAKQAAKNYIKRDNRVNIRISAADLNMVRKIAVEEGLPYQTLLSSIIHKFISGRLVDSGKR
ncbi:MAG: hypothetical protein A3E82_08040 [Gammaproteobacteria bacterium RIFCSPHIGHO2_12_FULL_38_11]|nr:MAG: hypothetical protein A3E82_08040 [Gammaproteobacteria bacterium RIFCSPHIGHO2_12_FULL_38_11]